MRKRAAIKFLTKGDKVKASIRFKGREMAHRTLAETTLKRLQEDLKELGAAERRPSMEGRVMAMIVNPLPDVVKAAEAKRKSAKGKKGKDEDEEDAEVEALLKAQEDDTDDDEVEDHIDYDIDELAQADVTAKIDEVCCSRPRPADGMQVDACAGWHKRRRQPGGELVPMWHLQHTQLAPGPGGGEGGGER